MVFSLKMASNSMPVSMKKPLKKQDVFRASRKSFFLHSWSAPGQCPMAVFIFFLFFLDFWPKMVPKKGTQKSIVFGRCGSRNAPKTHLRRNLDFSLMLHGFWIPFSLIFGTFGSHCGFFSLLVRRFRRFPNTYPLNMIRRFPPGVRRSALCAHNELWRPFLHWFFDLFQKCQKCEISKSFMSNVVWSNLKPPIFAQIFHYLFMFFSEPSPRGHF